MPLLAKPEAIQDCEGARGPAVVEAMDSAVGEAMDNVHGSVVGEAKEGTHGSVVGGAKEGPHLQESAPGYSQNSLSLLTLASPVHTGWQPSGGRPPASCDGSWGLFCPILPQKTPPPLSPSKF